MEVEAQRDEEDGKNNRRCPHLTMPDAFKSSSLKKRGLESSVRAASASTIRDARWFFAEIPRTCFWLLWIASSWGTSTFLYLVSEFLSRYTYFHTTRGKQCESSIRISRPFSSMGAARRSGNKEDTEEVELVCSPATRKIYDGQGR